MDVVVPQLGESVIEARIARWVKHEGDSVASGDVLVELETDKIDLEVSAESAGVLSKIARQDGEDVKVGEVLGVIEPGAQGAQSAKGAHGAGLQGLGANPLASSKPAAASSQPAQASTPAAAPRSTATARRVAEEHGVDLLKVPGTGDGGRVTRDDVEKHVGARGQGSGARDQGPGASAPAAGRPVAPVAPSVPAPSAPRAPLAPRAPAGERSEERIRMSKRRATIARRLVEAQHTAAMLTTFNEVDMSAVQALRARRKEAFQKSHGVNLGLSSFFVKAAVGALKAFPRINAEIQGDEMVLKHYYDIGIAVGASTGLVVPVLRDAGQMTFWEIEASIKDFAKRAEDGTLSLEEIKGGTFTITNGGVFGSLLSTPILNPPQVGILGLHKIEERPVAIGGQVFVRPMMYVALSYDHRIVDGLEAVQFLVKIKEFIEDPGHLLIEG
jgi:2-oxoglutarate dehydrogenase E2 component (dihydrolipoamide succinyltransferase)